jgi:tetratricopeptide (TPR) repeat protein
VAYLPLRASRSPAANWLDPQTLGGVVRHLSAHQIRQSFAGQIFTRDFGLLREHAGEFVAQLEGQLGVIILLVAFGGLSWLVARERTMGIVLGVILLGDLVYSSWINPMGIDDLQCGTPAAVALAICAGAGLLAAARRLPERGQPFLAGALAVISLVPAVWSDHEAKFSLGFEATTWSRAALAEAPPRATVYATTDDLLAGMFYEQVVAGLRPDVKVIARQQSHTKMEPPAMWEAGGDLPPIGVLDPGLPLERWSMTPAPLPEAKLIGEHAALLLDPAREPFARRLFAGALTGLGRSYALRGEEEQGKLMFETALRVRPHDAVALTNLAVLRAKDGDFQGALQLCDEVLARDPSRVVTRLNAARYRMALSDFDGAEREFREVLRRSPNDAGALAGLQKLRHH